MARSRGTWTTEQARVMAAKGRESQARRRANTPTIETLTAEKVMNGNDNAHTRCVRLWAMLETIDARIAETLAHAHPSAGQVKAARELAALAQSLKNQAGPEEPKRKTQAQPAAVVLPEPLPEP